MIENGKQRRGGAKIGLALAGGAPAGAIYEIGALRAIDKALDGIDFNALHTYVGVSAGAVVAACLANQVTSAQMCRFAVGHDRDCAEVSFSPEAFFVPAVGEMVHRGLMTPRLAFDAFREYLANSPDGTLFQAVQRLGRALPVAIFNNEPIRKFLQRVLSVEGRTDDFRKLRRDLIVVAADLDSGEGVRFGSPGLDHIPISRAVQASTALPGIYPPVEIEGRHYVDGVLLKTLHASAALERGVDLLFCVNPVVPVDTGRAIDAGVMRRGKLIHRGLPSVLSQTVRTLVHSRLTVGLAAYESRYPGQDVVLIEPARDDYDMFFTNIFSFSARRAVCEHAYESTLGQLRERRAELEPVLARRGIRFRDEVLQESGRDLWSGIGLTPDGRTAPVAEQLDLTLTRLENLLRDLPS